LGWASPVHVSPILEPVYLSPLLPDLRFRAVILTSEAAALAARNLSGLPKLAWCVGDRTATVARRVGFDAHSANGDASDLFAAILMAAQPGPLLYLHGRETRGGFVQDLISAGIETHSVLAYEQNPRPLTPAALRLIRKTGPVILPIFSPRSAALLVTEWQEADAKAAPHVIALSQSVADSAAALHPASLTIAARPDGDSLLAAIRQMTLQTGWA
jgi:uroporphyrinogen-III synthase